MTQSTQLNATSINDLVEDFRAKQITPNDVDRNAIEKQIKGLERNSREKTYELIVELRKLVKTIRKADKAEQDSFLAFRGGLKAARTGTNLYGPFVKAIFAQKVDGKWVFDRSREKYANVLRYLDDNGIKDSEVVDTLADKTMREVEKDDREANASGSQEKRVEDTRERGRTAPSITTLHMPPNLSAQPDQVVTLWGVYRNNQIEVKYAEVANDDKANSLLYKLGTTIKK